MEKALVKVDEPFVTDEESAEVPQGGEGAFHFPAFAVAAERVAILEEGASVAKMHSSLQSI